MDKSRQLMKSIFGLDNGFMRAAERIFDLILLNTLFLLTALPVVTVGLARIALYRSLVDLKDRGRLPVVATYAHHLKTNWKQGLVLGGLDLLVWLVIGLDLFLLTSLSGTFASLLGALAYAMLFLSIATHLYLYPLAGKYQMSLKDLYLKSILLAGLNGHWTLLFLLGLGLVFLAMQSSVLAFFFGLGLLVLIGCAGLTYAYMLVMEQILSKYPSQG